MISLDSVRKYCLHKAGKITEEFPFDEETLVFKVNGKSFLLTNINEVPVSMNLKCEPERAILLREKYEAIRPGYHMNKKYWNTVDVDGSIPEKLIYELIDHSYDEVVKKFSQKMRAKLSASKKNKK